MYMYISICVCECVCECMNNIYIERDIEKKDRKREYKTYNRYLRKF